MSKTNGKPKPRKRRKDAYVADAASSAHVPQRTARRKIKRCDQIVDLATLLAAAKGGDDRAAGGFAKAFVGLAVNVSDADLAAIAKLPEELRLAVAARLWDADKPSGADLFAEMGRPKPTKAEQLIADVCQFHSESTDAEWDVFRAKLLARGFVIGHDNSERMGEHCGDDAEWIEKVADVVEAIQRSGRAIAELPVARFDALVSLHGEHHSQYRPVVEDDAASAVEGEPDETETEPETETAATWTRSENSTAPASGELVGAT